MIKVTLNALGIFNLKNKEYILEEKNITLKEFFSKYLLKNQEQLNMFFPQDDNPPTHIIFLNGVVTRNEAYLLQDGDKILIATMLGGG